MFAISHEYKQHAINTQNKMLRVLVTLFDTNLTNVCMHTWSAGHSKTFSVSSTSIMARPHDGTTLCELYTPYDPNSTTQLDVISNRPDNNGSCIIGSCSITNQFNDIIYRLNPCLCIGRVEVEQYNATNTQLNIQMPQSEQSTQLLYTNVECASINKSTFVMRNNKLPIEAFLMLPSIIKRSVLGRMLIVQLYRRAILLCDNDVPTSDTLRDTIKQLIKQTVPKTAYSKNERIVLAILGRILTGYACCINYQLDISVDGQRNISMGDTFEHAMAIDQNPVHDCEDLTASILIVARAFANNGRKYDILVYFFFVFFFSVT